ncbi:MAG: FAD-binding dehydrogenase [Nitriliruptorales bacterium]|nr:FAD-binding dehydrogenase [Nitriliruptorales bacterium]
MAYDADIIVVGGGLAGLVATAEAADAGRKVILLDQEPEQSLGGQAFWSFGGLFFVDSPEQRRMGITDTHELAWQDWLGTAGFDREEDHWPRKWAEAYVDWAAGEKYEWVKSQGVSFFPVVGWAERGAALAGGHGNSVPRFHITWGTGPGLVEPFERRVREHAEAGRVELRFRHRVDELTTEGGAVTGVSGTVLAPSDVERGERSNRDEVGEFALTAQAVIVSSGGIGGNFDLVRKNWPEDRVGPAPENLIAGVPHHVDGRMLGITESAGGRIINRDRMWHYTEGIRNWAPIWPKHGIRILPGPSSQWLDATGRRLPVPGLPGYDTLGTLELILKSGYDYSWFVLTESIIEKEFGLSGQEQNPDLTGRNWKGILGRARGGAPGPVQKFIDHGADFVVADNLEALVRGMNTINDDEVLDFGTVRHEVQSRDRQLLNDYSKDLQIAAMHHARNYLGDKLFRVAPPHRILDPDHGPLIGVKLNILTRKTLGGLETDLDSQVMTASGDPLDGVYAAGEVAGFGGGGVHGYRSLEGTFLGGCLFSGRTAGRAAAAAVG